MSTIIAIRKRDLAEAITRQNGAEEHLVGLVWSFRKERLDAKIRQLDTEIRALRQQALQQGDNADNADANSRVKADQRESCYHQLHDLAMETAVASQRIFAAKLKVMQAKEDLARAEYGGGLH